MDRIIKLESKYFRSSNETILAEEKMLTVNQPFHWHDFYEIEYIIDGAGEYRINGNKYKIKPGVLFFSTPTDFHEIIFEKETHLINISFIAQLVDEKLLTEVTGCVVTNDKDNYYHTMVRNILNRLYNPSKHSMLYMTSILNALLVSIMENKENAHDVQIMANKYFYETILYINGHFNEPITLQELAENIKLTPQYLSKMFHKLAGVTISQYITSMRLNYAKSLAVGSTLPINEVCFKSGFNSMEHFSRCFKEKFGSSPSQYRIKHKTI